MRRHLHHYLRSITSLVLVLSVLCSSFLIAPGQNGGLSQDESRDEAYAQHFRRIRGANFENLLIKHVGIDAAPSVLDWFDANNARLFRVLDTAYQNNVKKVIDESIIAPTAAGANTTPTRRASFDRPENVFWQNAAYKQDDEIVITKTETDDGFEMGTAVEKSKTVGDVVVTQGAAGKTRALLAEGGNVGTEYRGVEYTELDNKAERTKVRTESTTSWRILTASCPDANGISAGTGTMTNAVKVTITTPHTIGIMNRDYTTTLTIKGTVNDAAELTHFDLIGNATETITGYDRAERLGLIDDAEFHDGTKGLGYRITNSKLGKPVTDEYGFTKKIGRELGYVSVTKAAGTSDAEVRRVDGIAGHHVAWISEQAAMAFETAQQAWRNEGCVRLALTAPKTRLAAGEEVDVTAETNHKFDKSKVNARLSLKGATASASPEDQRGEPQGIFSLTAPPKGEKAKIIIESVSRRGIALEILYFEEEKAAKKAPTPRPKSSAKVCNGNWSGKITAVKTKRTDTSKPASGRLVRSVEHKEETFSIDYHVLGVRDTSQGFSNAFFSDAQMNYRAAEYRELNYAPGKMSCSNSIITTQQTQKYESLMTALSSKRITVYITSTGEQGILTFDSPEINAERIITRTYESSCASYNQTNSGVDRSDGLIEVPSPGFEVTFELDAGSNSKLVGTKKIENSDGSTTTVTWNLTRSCG